MAPSPGGCRLLWCLGTRSSADSDSTRQASTSKAGVAEEASAGYPDALHYSLGPDAAWSAGPGHHPRTAHPSTAGSQGKHRGPSGNKIVPLHDAVVGEGARRGMAATAGGGRDSPRDSPPQAVPLRPERRRPTPPDMGAGDSMGTLQNGLESLTGDQLYAAGFKLYTPNNVTQVLGPSANVQPLTFLVLDLGRMQAHHHAGPTGRDYDSGSGNGRASARAAARSGPGAEGRIGRNALVPVFINSCCRVYFKIKHPHDYIAVAKKLLKRDPLLSFALQKAVRNLKAGEQKSVSHVTPDPSGQTSSLYGLRLTPCVWRQDGRVLPALMVEHNLPYDPDVVMPRLMRDYAVLSHVPAILTLIDFEGKVLYQNASSLEYMGDLLSAKYNAQLSDGLLQVLYMFDLHSLEQMLEHVLGGNEWQGVVQVPYSLRRYLGHQQDSDTVIDFMRVLADPRAAHGNGGARPSPLGLPGGGHHDYMDDFSDDEFQIGGAHRRGRAGAPALMVRQTSAQMARPGSSAAAVGRGPDHSVHAGVVAERHLLSNSPRFGSGTERRGSGNGAATERRGSFLAVTDMAPGMQQRKFMSLLDKQVGAAAQASGAGGRGEARGSDAGAGAGPRGLPGVRGSEDGTEDEDALAGIMQDDGDELEDSDDQECYHEVHAIPLLDPVLDKQVIMLVQTDVTPRVELENKLADLTDAQLSMLEQLFPRHIIEYMLARVPSKVSNNMRDLANTHEKVMVLFCDVVGFTSMSKEVEAAQVMHFLNELYEAFDELVDDYGMYKLDIVGDCYIVVAGLIKEDQDGFVCVDELEDDQVAANAVRIMGFAKKMLQTSNDVLYPHNHQPVSLRIGIHTGPLVSGLVGSKMPKFTLFGDTMNTASRMESTCRPGCIHVSDAFGQLLPGESWESTGGVEVKGKGLMMTFLWVPEANPPLGLEEGEVDPSDPSRPLRKNQSALNQSFNSSKSKHTARSNSMRRRESQTSGGGDGGRGDSLSNNPLLTILHNIGNGFREDEAGGDGMSTSGPLGGSRPKSSKGIRMNRRAPSTASPLDMSADFSERRSALTDAGFGAGGAGASGTLRPRASGQSGASGRGLAQRISAAAAGSRRASYLEPLAAYPQAPASLGGGGGGAGHDGDSQHG